MKIQPDAMEVAADHASALLKALANRHRLLILCQLVDGERSVGDLAGFLKARDSNVSQHLALLRKDGLVRARRDAQTIYYSIASGPAQKVLETLFAIYCAPAPMCGDAATPPQLPHTPSEFPSETSHVLEDKHAPRPRPGRSERAAHAR